MGVNVANAFLQILLANEQVKISKSQVDLSIAQLDNTKKLVAAGSPFRKATRQTWKPSWRATAPPSLPRRTTPLSGC